MAKRLFVGLLLFGVLGAIGVEGAAIRVGVYVASVNDPAGTGYGATRDAINSERNMTAEFFAELSAEKLAKYDAVVFWQIGYNADRKQKNFIDDEQAETVRRWVKNGGGLLGYGDSVGFARHASKPLFPEIAEGAANSYPDTEGYKRECVITADGPISRGIPVGTRFAVSYYDYVTLKAGPEGKTAARAVTEIPGGGVIGNPVIQLLGDTAAVSELAQCNMLYDLHFRHAFCRIEDAPPIGTKLNAKFRIFGLSKSEAEALLAEAVSAPVLTEEREEKRYPRYEKNAVNSFATAISLDVPDHSRVWKPFHHDLGGGGSAKAIVKMDIREWDKEAISCAWDRTTGFSDHHSLRVRTTVPAVAGWQLVYFDQLDTEPGCRYKLSCRVKTENLVGFGAAIGYALPGDTPYLGMDKEKLKPRLSGPLSGSHDWTEISAITPPIEEVDTWPRDGKWKSRKLQVILWHDGEGTSWFDDFAIEKFPS